METDSEHFYQSWAFHLHDTLRGPFWYRQSTYCDKWFYNKRTFTFFFVFFKAVSMHSYMISCVNFDIYKRIPKKHKNNLHKEKLTISVKIATAQNENRVSTSPHRSPKKLPSGCCSPHTYLATASSSISCKRS